MQVFFLPWAEIKSGTTIGPTVFWPYFKESEERISDLKIKEFFDRYFKLFVDHQGKQVKTITICQHGDLDFRDYSFSEQHDIRNAVDILIFSSILPKVKQAVCTDNKSIGPPSADAFELVRRSFKPNDHGVAVSAGSRTDLYFNTEKISISMPWAMGGVLWEPEDILIEGLGCCFQIADREAIFRSLEWFRMAHIETGQYSRLTKVVMMATAFEILLQVGDFRKRERFALYIDDNVASLDNRKEIRESDGFSYYLSLPGCWAWDFYRLRSKIVHGDKIDDRGLIFRDWITQFEVADLVFYELVLRRLFELNYIGDDVRSCAAAFEDAVTDSDEKMPLEPVLRALLGFNDIHKALGWME